MAMAYEQILLEKDGPAAIITFNRPDKLNAYTAQMGQELTHAVNACDMDDDVRGVILTGAGRHFCAGADISDGAGAFDTKSGSGAKNFGKVEEGKPGNGAGFIGALYGCRKPLIAAFNGAAVGVGLTMALPTDIKIARRKPSSALSSLSGACRRRRAQPGSCLSSSVCRRRFAGV
jgi:enoyl-CoA hydratase/carnithine racemase